jgi:mRNA interferase MazF
LVTKRSLYVPERGDIVYLNFDPTKGHEQRGHRPAFIISPRIYNQKSLLALFMPITSHAKGYPFEVALPVGLKTQGVILSDQVKSLDWKARSVSYIETGSAALISEVQAKVEPLIL